MRKMGMRSRRGSVIERRRGYGRWRVSNLCLSVAYNTAASLECVRYSCTDVAVHATISPSQQIGWNRKEMVKCRRQNEEKTDRDSR